MICSPIILQLKPSFFSFISLFQIFATEITNLIAKTEELNSKCLIVV